MVQEKFQTAFPHSKSTFSFFLLTYIKGFDLVHDIFK